MLWLLPPPWIRHFHKIITSGSNYARSFFPGSFRWVHDLSLGKFPAKTVTLTDFHCFGRRKQKKDHKNGCKYSFTNVQMLRYTFEDVFWNCWHKINYVCLLSVDLNLYVDMPKGVDFSLQGDTHIYLINFDLYENVHRKLSWIWIDIFYKLGCIFNEKLAPIETYFPMTRSAHDWISKIKAGSFCICDVVRN